MSRATVRLAVTILVILLVAGFLGFIGVTSYSWGHAETVFFVVVVVALVTLLGGVFFRRRESC